MRHLKNSTANVADWNRIKRYNRTTQEEYVDNYLDIIDDKPLLHRKLAEYLIFYNTRRVHKSLGNKTPIDYLIEQRVLPQMCLTYTDN